MAVKNKTVRLPLGSKGIFVTHLGNSRMRLTDLLNA